MTEAEAFDLDDDVAIRSLDSENVLGAVEGFAEQCRDAWNIGITATGLPDGVGVETIAVLGMGGSGVSGDVVQSVAEPRLPLPFRVIKSYAPLPEWVGRNTLVFAVSYSGSTEETVAALEDAHAKGARIVAISSGGPLGELAVRYGITHIAIPSGLQPRASLPYLTLPLLAALESMGLIPTMGEDVEETVGIISGMAARCHRSVAANENPAKRLAVKLRDKVPVIYGGYGLGATAAMRFKCDLNEYGKSPAFWNFFPELNHNEIVGWNKLADVTKERFVLVLLRDKGEHPRIGLRFEITRGLIESRLAEVIELESEGESSLARLMSLIFLTQLAAIYVGLAHRVDPGPVEVLMKLKNELSNR
ncbi:MAG: bifunctional phosphoglucose/phosphomannose isomerase [Actinobacteria bacterium]|nr:bifunctional phosphoglucose/phosphomannose isomerase [Actinomycetota bacterium]